jgi:hypothetical protein
MRIGPAVAPLGDRRSDFRDGRVRAQASIYKYAVHPTLRPSPLLAFSWVNVGGLRLIPRSSCYRGCDCGSGNCGCIPDG